MRRLDELRVICNEQPYPLLFATVSGAHLYGFDSPDSDFDLRGAHILPASEVVGLFESRDTIESMRVERGMELDLVTHDVRKFFQLLLKKNGYVLEQLYSPLIVQGGPDHEELKEIAKHCITRHHAHHYLGFTETQWGLFLKESPRRVKPLLYTFRVLLTGIHLMRTGIVEADLRVLNTDRKLPYIKDLIALKTSGTEKQTLEESSIEFYEGEVNRLREELQTAYNASTLPETPTAADVLNAMLVRLRVPS